MKRSFMRSRTTAICDCWLDPLAGAEGACFGKALRLLASRSPQSPEHQGLVIPKPKRQTGSPHHLLAYAVFEHLGIATNQAEPVLGPGDAGINQLFSKHRAEAIR